MPRNFLKVDLHTHTADDPEELILHSSCELIDRAHSLGFDAISITNHNAISFSPYLRDYAREREIILIPGVELDIERKHVLIVNASEEILGARNFNDLRRLRTSAHMIVAPHPYFPGWASLLWKTRRNIDVFDAIEYSWFYHSRVNFNMLAMKTASRYGLPLLCTSDCHHLQNFGSAYSLVSAEKDAEAIVDAVKAGRVEICANPLTWMEFGRHGIDHIVGTTAGLLKNLLVSKDQ